MTEPPEWQCCLHYYFQSESGQPGPLPGCGRMVSKFHRGKDDEAPRDIIMRLEEMKDSFDYGANPNVFCLYILYF